MGDGLLGKCKECTRVDVRENYAKRREQYLEYERGRSRTPERRAGIRLSQVKWSDRHRARRLLQGAVARGEIVRPKECQECGVGGRIDGHHPDYTKPLDVMWLCRRCHMKLHRMESAA
jgi:hypothetical protein